MEKKDRRFTFSIGPLGLSLVAAALTAAAFAAVSVADNGSGDRSGSDERSFHVMPAPGPAGPGVMFGDNLSEADRQKLEDFRKCMEDNGAPAPPEPGEIDPSEFPPKPPSAEDREKLQSAWEACRDKLPEELRNAGPPTLHFRGCEPGEGDRGLEERGERENQNDDSSASSSGATT